MTAVALLDRILTATSTSISGLPVAVNLEAAPAV
jgi:hypothetical protein